MEDEHTFLHPLKFGSKSGIIGGAETGIFRPVEHVWEEVNDFRWMLGSGLNQLLSCLNNKDDNVSCFNFT